LLVTTKRNRPSHSLADIFHLTDREKMFSHQNLNIHYLTPVLPVTVNCDNHLCYNCGDFHL